MEFALVGTIGKSITSLSQYSDLWGNFFPLFSNDSFPVHTDIIIELKLFFEEIYTAVVKPYIVLSNAVHSDHKYSYYCE